MPRSWRWGRAIPGAKGWRPMKTIPRAWKDYFVRMGSPSRWPMRAWITIRSGVCSTVWTVPCHREPAWSFCRWALKLPARGDRRGIGKARFDVAQPHRGARSPGYRSWRLEKNRAGGRVSGSWDTSYARRACNGRRMAIAQSDGSHQAAGRTARYAGPSARSAWIGELEGVR